MKNIVRIEISNGDNCMHEDGIPRNVIVTLVEKSGEKTVFPYATSHKIKELFKAFSFSSAPVSLQTSTAPITHMDTLTAENQNAIDICFTKTMSVIQYNYEKDKRMFDVWKETPDGESAILQHLSRQVYEELAKDTSFIAGTTSERFVSELCRSLLEKGIVDKTDVSSMWLGGHTDASFRLQQAIKGDLAVQGTPSPSSFKKPIVNQNKDKFEVGDIIIYNGPPSEDGDLKSGAEYRLISIGKYSHSVVSDIAPVKIRLSVSPKYCKLIKKGIRGYERKPIVFDHTHVCNCGEINSLELNGTKYVGKCSKCGACLNVERETFKVSGAQTEDTEMKDLLEQLKGVAFEP